MTNDEIMQLKDLTHLLFDEHIYNHDDVSNSLNGKRKDYIKAYNLLKQLTHEQVDITWLINFDYQCKKNNNRIEVKTYEEYCKEFWKINKECKQDKTLLNKRYDLAYKIVHSKFFNTKAHLQQLKNSYFQALRDSTVPVYDLFYLSILKEEDYPELYRNDTINNERTNWKKLWRILQDKL